MVHYRGQTPLQYPKMGGTFGEDPPAAEDADADWMAWLTANWLYVLIIIVLVVLVGYTVWKKMK